MSPPRFSVIVPSYGRTESVEACLSALAELGDPAGGFEVVLVDDGNPAPLEPRLGHWGERLALRFVRRPHGGPAAARNAGLAVATGEIAAFTAADCLPRADWLTRLAARFDGEPDTAVGGWIENGLADNLFSSATDLLIRYLYEYYNTPPDDARFFTPNNLAFPARALRSEGGFRSSFRTGEDRELCHRWRMAGRRLAYAPEVVVRHVHPLNFRSFCLLHYRYGQGSRRFRGEAARRTPEIRRFEPLSFYLNLLRYPMTRVEGPRARALSALLGVSQVANAAGYFRQALER